MRRKTSVLVTALGILVFFALDSYATVKCKTRSRCRSWAKEYVAKAKTRCAWAGTLCNSRTASCGVASASCPWQNCSNGGATAFAQNSAAGCFLTGARSGRGRYGEPAADPGADGSESYGDHDMASFVSFQEGRSATLAIDQMTMTSTLDESFGRLDVIAYVESKEGLANDDDELPPERIVWQGYIHLQNGVVTQKGFDEELREYLERTDVTKVVLEGIEKIIPFDGTEEEFERFAVDVVADGAGSENAR